MSEQEEGENGLSSKCENIHTLSSLQTFFTRVHPARCRRRSDASPPSFPSVLTQESERLESLNSDLKAQIEELKLERQQLILMLNRHRPTCIVRTDSVQTAESEAE